MQSCTVCGSKLIKPFNTSDSLKYWSCNLCAISWIKNITLINMLKKRYLEHEKLMKVIEPFYTS